MNRFFILLPLIALFSHLSSAFAQDLSLYHYEFNTIGVRVDLQTGDHFTRKLRDSLLTSGVQDQCLDLRREFLISEKLRLPDSSGTLKKVESSVHLLTRGALSRQALEALIVDHCAGENSECEAFGWVSETTADHLALKFVYRTKPSWEKGTKLAEKKVSLPAIESFPRFSSSCESARTEESILYTGRSIEAQSLIKLSPVAPEKLVRIELWTQKNEFFWSFGRPDLWWKGLPTTEQEQELAPEEILKQLD